MQNHLLRIPLITLGLVLCISIISCRAAGQELPQSEMQTTETASVSTQTVAPSETTLAPETAVSTTVSEAGETFSVVTYTTRDTKTLLHEQDVAYIQQYGNPDPLPDCVVFDHQTDIQLRPFQSSYSMPNERSVWACRIEIPETLSVVAYSRYLNLEQQIGENWVRLSVRDENRVYHEENHADLAGRSLILEFDPNKAEPAITPGKYRFIFYAAVEQDGKTENRMYYVPFEVVA